MNYHDRECRAYLREAVGPSLEDDQEDSNGHGDLLQDEAVSHPGPAQHAAHAVPSSLRYLPQTDGQAVELGWRQAEALQHWC